MRTRALSARLLAVSAAALIAATVLPAGGGPGAGAVTADGGRAAPPARGAGEWTKVSSGVVRNIDRPALHRAPDGVLSVVYHRDEGSTAGYGLTRVATSGVVLDRSTALTGWDALTEDPRLVFDGEVLRLVFGGIAEATDGAGFFSQGYVYNAVSVPGSGGWAVPEESYGADGTGVSSYGTGVTTYGPDDTPVVAWPLNTTLRWVAGTTGTVSTAESTHCCLYDVALAEHDGEVWAGWYQNGSTAATNGVFVRRLLPDLGPVLKAPGSSERGDSVAPSQAVAMAATDAGPVLAYCSGYPTCDRLLLWRIGSSRTRTVPASADAVRTGLAARPDGRLWVMWARSDGDVRAVRTDPGATRFGKVRALGHPPGSDYLFGLAVDAGRPGQASVVVNTGSALFHHRVLPAVTLDASPTSWRVHERTRVSFRVTDAGAPIEGAAVQAAGDLCRTSAAGRCSITVPPLSRPARLSAIAWLTGWAPDSVRLRVRR